MSAPDFTTDREQEAFEDFIKQPEHTHGASIEDRMRWAWCASRAYHTEGKTSGETDASRHGRSDSELRNISVHLNPRDYKTVYAFINEAMTPREQELSIQAVQAAQGIVHLARQILDFLQGE